MSTLGEWRALQAELKEGLQVPSYLHWLSVTDREEEGVWRDWYTGQQNNYTLPFTGTGPNGGTRENCAVQITDDNWVDGPCSDKGKCCICSNSPRPILTLRGLCPGPYIDYLFLVKNKRNVDTLIHMDTEFVSDINAVIEYNHRENKWNLMK